MKCLYLNLLAFFILSAATAQPVNPPNKTATFPGDEKYENKTALRKMISDRNFPVVEGNNFGRYSEEMLHYRNGSIQQLAANWTTINVSGNPLNDIGRTASITFDTINTGRFYVCTPHSGVWLTNNNGLTYTPITESLPTQNTSCLVIDPSNTNILYLGTGTYQMDMKSNSMGVYKSTDGGASWNATGLTFSPSSEFNVGQLAINPLNPNSILAATTDGLYRTYNSGTSWTKILNDSTTNVVYKTGDTTIIYTMGSRYYRSDDSGTNFVLITSGINVNFQWKYEYFLKTSAAFPDVVYIFTAGGFANPSFNTKLYIHKSTDSGLTFSILDSLAGEVAYQTAVSQTSADKFMSGYWNVFLKNDSSSLFQRKSQWYSGGPFEYMHADQRGIMFDPHNDSIIYFCNDGGLYRSVDNGSTFLNITGNMELSHFYDFGQSQDTSYKIIVAPLDVPPFMVGDNGIDFSFNQFAEGFATAMSPLNDDHYYLTHQSPLFTQNNGANFYGSTHPLIGNSSYVPNSLQYDHCNANVCYFSNFNELYKSTDGGASFGYFVRSSYNPINSFLKTPQGYVVCRANPRYVYIYYSDSVFVTTNGANPLTNITGNLPVSSAVISAMAVDPENENKVWIGFSGYSAGNKIFYSSDGGQNWTNVSTGLPNVPVTGLVCQPGIPGAIYASTDGGVFYKDNTFISWQYYNTGLPNVIVTGIDIQVNDSKLRVATFGRGVWESDLYQPIPAGYVYPPVALFNNVIAPACIGENITIENNSCGIVDSVLWLFPGGSPATSTDYSPNVNYAAAGNYSVTLIAYNSGGSDTLTVTNIITVETPQSLPYYEPVGDLNLVELPGGYYATEVNGDDVSWFRGFWVDGSGGPGDDFIYYDNFSTNLNGQEESLVLPKIDLTGTVNPKLFFYRAHALRNLSTTDSLKVAVKSCGGLNTIMYAKGGFQLATSPVFVPNGWWYPTSPSEWIRDSVDLTPFAGDPAATISFINRGYMGQLIFIDDFRILETSSVGLNEFNIPVISIFPNPAKDEIHIRAEGYMISKIFITDLTGRIVMTHGDAHERTSISISSLSKGIYFLNVNEKVYRIEKM